MSAAAQANGHPSTDIPTTTSTAQGSSKIQPSDVGWQFVPQYYNFVHKEPHRLHCFYTKQSTFVHGEEGDETTVALGQQEIHERIVKIGYDQCKVYINSIDSQSSAGGGIIIQVLGEMSNANKPWRKFAQTFFLAEQPNGYFVLNDIFRYLKEDTDEDEEPEVEEAPIVSAAPAAQAEQAHAQAAPVAPVAAVVEAKEATPEPEVEKPVVAAEPEPTPAPAPKKAPKEAAPEPAAPVAEKAAEPAVKEAAPAPAAKAPAASSSTPTESKSATPAANGTPAATSGATTPAAAPAALAAPAAPAKPAAPKSWATLAAGGKSWASQLGGSAAAAAPAAAPAPAAKKAEAPVAAPVKAAPAPAAAAPAPAAAADADAAAAAAPAPAGGRHPFYENALKVQTPHCFVKLPNWSAQEQGSGEAMDENALRNIASRFGEVVKVEIVKGKACAFVEFQKVESARKAIIASLGTHQGGEGGIVHGGDGKLNFETRKEKDERGPKGRRGGAPDTQRGGARVGGQGRDGEQAQRGGSAGRGRGRGRGGANNAQGGDRPAAAAK